MLVIFLSCLCSKVHQPYTRKPIELKSSKHKWGSSCTNLPLIVSYFPHWYAVQPQGVPGGELCSLSPSFVCASVWRKWGTLTHRVEAETMQSFRASLSPLWYKSLVQWAAFNQSAGALVWSMVRPGLNLNLNCPCVSTQHFNLKMFSCFIKKLIFFIFYWWIKISSVALAFQFGHRWMSMNTKKQTKKKKLYVNISINMGGVLTVQVEVQQFSTQSSG